jgi:alkylation response protein AidB-like acyl-CoA dehydrogenase
MDFTLSAEQRQFAGSLHEMLAAADAPAAAREWAAGHREPGLKIWRALAEAGATALVIPADHGGLAASPVELVIACEEIGHHAVPGPVAESLAAVPILLAAAARDFPPISATQIGSNSVTASLKSGESRVVGDAGDNPRPLVRGLLSRLASGDLVGTLAVPPLLPYAADADAAGLLLLAEAGPAAAIGGAAGARIPGPAGAAARLWTAAVTGRAFRSVDPSRTVSEVAPGELLAEGPEVALAISAALDYGALASAAQLLGAGRALLEAAARHASERVQFGQPVGSFQAVKHLLADVLIALEFARPLLFGGAVALAGNSATAARDVSAARVACADAAYRAARTALQVHGAIGYTAEHDVSLFLTKVQALKSVWGTQSYHRARVLASLRGAGGESACD